MKLTKYGRHKDEIELPIDLWVMVAVYLTRKDLNSLCRISSKFLNILRPLLYRHFSLAWDAPPDAACLKLLCSNPSLAGRVSSFRLMAPLVKVGDPNDDYYHEYTPAAVPQLYLKTLLHLPALRKLELRGNPFSDDADLQPFLEHLRNKKIHLEELVVDWSPPYQNLTGDRYMFSLPHLKRLSWKFDCDDFRIPNGSEPEEILVPLWCVLEASQATLEAIAIPAMHRLDEFYLPLWSMHFPKLKSLSLATCKVGGDSDAKASAQFVSKHNRTLEVLEFLPPSVIPPRRSVPQLAGFATPSSCDPLDSESLPNLSRYVGPACSFLQLAHLQVKSLSTSLSRLEFSTRCIEHLEEPELLERFAPILEDGPQPLLALRELRLIHWVEPGREEVLSLQLKWMRFCSKFCGKRLRVWLDDYTDPMDATDFASGLSSYQELKVIHLRASVLGESINEDTKEWSVLSNEDVERYTKILAERLTELEEVVVTHTRRRKDISVGIKRIMEKEDAEVSYSLLELTGVDMYTPVGYYSEGLLA